MPAAYVFESKVLQACHVGSEIASERKKHASDGFLPMIYQELGGMYRSYGVQRKARDLSAISRC